MSNDTVMVSGGFDPIHVGHIRLIREASKYGDVIVAMNSDDWIFRQKGFNSIGFKERKEFLMSIKGVVEVVSVCDEDDTVCAALIEHKPTYFANGGPRLLCKRSTMGVPCRACFDRRGSVVTQKALGAADSPRIPCSFTSSLSIRPWRIADRIHRAGWAS